MTGRVLGLIAAAIVGVLVLCTGLTTALLVGGGPGASTACAGLPSAHASGGAVTLTPPAGGWPGIGNWAGEQVGHAATIITVGAHLNVPPRGWVIAIATAITESGLRNLGDQGAANDHDSLGLFQQRPSQGWGTPAQIMDPVHASTAFYQHLLKVPGWQSMPLTDAAQAVQMSAYPNAYARHEADAQQLVGALTGLAAGLGACTGNVGPQGWTQPVHGPIVSGFRTADRPNHNGVDIAAPKGTPIHAASAGTVTVVTCNAIAADGSNAGCDHDGSPQIGGCGWYVDITHADGVITRYCHQLVHPAVFVGQHINAGEVIGVVGSSGNSSGPHLHYETHLHGDGSSRGALDPLPYMAAHGAGLQ